jgi:hypothetical protein
MALPHSLSFASCCKKHVCTVVSINAVVHRVMGTCQNCERKWLCLDSSPPVCAGGRCNGGSSWRALTAWRTGGDPRSIGRSCGESAPLLGETSNSMLCDCPQELQKRTRLWKVQLIPNLFRNKARSLRCFAVDLSRDREIARGFKGHAR